MPDTQTYTINEVATLTGRHPNTIRQRIKIGQLEATVQQGKFGEEYRITHEALVRAGFLSEAGPLEKHGGVVLEGEITEEGGGHGEGGAGGNTSTALASLGELYQRHEQAMFRLGYLQGELDRLKALEETAESLRRDTASREQEVQGLRNALAEKERKAAEAETLRQELDQTRERLKEVDALRQDLQQLKTLADHQERLINVLEDGAKRPWWQFWRG